MTFGSSDADGHSSGFHASDMWESCSPAMEDRWETIMALDKPTAADPALLNYLLRRAEQESIAAIRSIDLRASEPHARMACLYTAQAMSLLGSLPD